ncbi:carboxy terminal-processing peptidase [Pedobacter punctiformis]|uniref:Carboxy terminal-processing peptidase n=1 Tax=Pedobacter punctiformis TaxID=3004097 RepID=A0ABT4LAU7_9SPHI|nr:carboxy terminal-processing peptidase [Pedobacter sp. HCMS5-2]MCZ4245049.1 carboxy terminal-processing peptidase [Pedobacter sp. HCMS5-2]
MLYGLWTLSSANGQAITLMPNGEDFEPLPQHATIAKVIADMVANYHYKKTRIDDSLSTRIFDMYLDRLDKSHTLFLTSDIKGFETYRFQMDDALLSGNLSPAFEIYTVYAKRLNEQVDYTLSALKTTQNLFSTDVLDFTREQMPWFGSASEEEAYWNKRLRYELMLLCANKKNEKEARGILTKRYEKFKVKLENQKSENAFEQFMNAFVGTIDPHTAYLSPRGADDFNIMMNKSLVGIGIELNVQDEYPTIMNVIKGGPSEKSGQIAVNDRIQAVAEGEKGQFEEIIGWDLQESIQKIRGAAGSVVRLRILPAGATLTARAKEVTLIRDKIVLEDQKVKYEVKTIRQGNRERKIGLITIPNFYFDAVAYNNDDKNYTSTSNDVRKALEGFKSQGGVEGVMIDLRNNGGGSLKEAIDLSGLFIKNGPVVQLRDAQGKITVNSDPDSLLVYSGPLTVLINRLSASASEIFSAAMQDYGRAVIIGEQSFGKSTAQNIYPLNRVLQQPDKNYGQFNMTYAKFYRINGGSTQNRGVTPDVSFPSRYSSLSIGESTMKNALAYDEIAAAAFAPVSQMNGINKTLEKDHEERMLTNPEFKFLKEDIEKLKEINARKSLVLDLKKFEAIQAEQENEDLKRTNERRKLLGLTPITATEAQEKPKVDYVKDESLQVTAELISKIEK